MTRERVNLATEPSSVKAARGLLDGLRDVVPPALFDDVVLVADELVTQALLADPSTENVITLNVVTNRNEVTIAVEDSAVGQRPRGPFGSTDHLPELGLVIVNEVADRWGMEKRGDTTRTWVTFMLPSPADAIVGGDIRESVVDITDDLTEAQ